MKKGYLIANIRVTDADKFQAFSGMAAPAIAQYGGEVLVRGPGAHRHEGTLHGTVMVIGEIIEVLLPDNALAEDGFVDLAQMDTVTIGGLDGYYRVEPLFRLSYAKPDQPPKRM